MKSYISNVMINVKSILRIGILSGCIFLLSNQDLKATHIVGGDLTYRCLGNDIYQLRLTVRRDCFNGAPGAQFDDPASIGFFDGTTHTLLTSLIGYPEGQVLIDFNADDTLNEILISDCSVIFGDVCVHTTVYTANVFLPFRPTGYLFAYQRCCRNATLNNIVDPLSAGMTLVAELSGIAQLACNSSPQFGTYPPIYTCTNKDISFDHSASDAEGDSLVYSLCTPFTGATIANPKPQPPNADLFGVIVWKPPYSLDNLLGGQPLTINPTTGLLTGRPDAVGQFVVGICVTAYDRGTGILSGTARRDFQYNVRACRDVPTANFSAPELECSSQTISFVNQSTLADVYKWIFDFENPASDSSSVLNPVFNYPEGGCYQVALVASDSAGFCHDTIIKEVCAFISELSADFGFDIEECTDSIVVQISDLSVDPGGFNVTGWNWILSYDSNVQFSTAQNPQFTLHIDHSTTVLIALVATSANGCTASRTRSFPVRIIPRPSLFGSQGGEEYVCFGDSVHLLLNGDSTLTYIWSPLTGLNLDKPWDPIAFPDSTTEYFVTATDGICEVTAQTIVRVQSLPNLGFTSSTDCQSLDAEFTNTSTNAEKYLWDFGVPDPVTTDTTSVASPVFTYPGPGNYTVTLYSQDGCDVLTSQVITVNTLLDSLDDQSTNCFQDSIDLNPDFNPLYTYTWSPVFGFDPNDPNPSAKIDDDTEFFVTITQAGLEGCEIVDSITVLIPDDFTVDAPSSFTNCKVKADTLIAELTGVGSGGVTLVWTDVNGVEIGTGETLIVSPDTTTSYIITGTDSLGCSKSDMVTISKSDPGFDVNILENDSAYCDIQIITLNGTSTISGVTFEWFNADTALIGTGSTVDVTPGTPSCYTLIGTDVLGCEDDQVVCLTPTFFNLNISNDQSICLAEEATISVTNNNPEQDLSYIWSPHGEISSSITVSPSETTTYTVIVTNDELGCKDTLSSEVVVNLFDPLVIVVTSDAPNDSIIVGEDIQLFVNQNSTFNFVWTSSNGDVVPNVGNPVFFPTGPGTYTVTVTNAEGCEGTASITLRVFDPPCNDEDIFLPTAFTPNGDGVNDILFVRSNFISTMELHIYNRWGEEVFQTTNKGIGWDGRYNGKELSPDVFGYYMDIGCPNGRSFFKKGNVTLLE